MKKILVLILCLAVFVSTIIGCSKSPRVLEKNVPPNKNLNPDTTKINADVRDANLKFAFDIFKALNAEEERENLFISPFSISTALTMTYQGAMENTKNEMAKVLGFSGIQDDILNESYFNLIGYLGRGDKKIELNIGNSLWVRDGTPINEEFIKVNNDIFGAPVTNLDFSKDESADKINQWISDSTKGKIDKMIDPPIDPAVIMYIINAIYFKGDWAEKFHKDQSFIKEFNPEKGDAYDVTMMRRHGEVEYGEGKGYKAVRLPYGDEKTAMYCILPSPDKSIKDFINSLDLTQWGKIKSSIKETDDLTLEIPRFKIEYGIKSLKDSLIHLGMGETFGFDANFQDIMDGAYISDVLHKALIEVNEEGSEAAAVTVVEIKEMAAQMEPLSFIADRPFVFIIADDETDTILFMGKVNDIEKS